MWIVQVHPQEEFVPYILSQPIQSNIRHHISGTFHLLKIRFLQTVEVEMVIVEIESLVQAEPRIQNRRADHRSGRIALLLEHISESGLFGIEFVSAEIVHPAQRRIGPGEKCGVGRQRDRHRRVRSFEAKALARERINIWSLNLLVAVATKVIRPQCIDGDKHYVRLRFRRG